MGSLDAEGYDGPTVNRILLIAPLPCLRAYHSTPFEAEWSVRKTSNAWSTLDAEPQTSPPPMIKLIPWPALSLNLPPIENMWSMVTQRLTQITPPAATPDQLWQRVDAAWSAVPREQIQRVFESMPRRVAVVISNNFSYSGY
ncbi:transposable element Tcb1 transposase [Trichonephila clavipes]|nr:transposable element Tcb1 transposase [Trichonephila clavipes]